MRFVVSFFAAAGHITVGLSVVRKAHSGAFFLAATILIPTFGTQHSLRHSLQKP